jgi:hypothetical protein
MKGNTLLKYIVAAAGILYLVSFIPFFHGDNSEKFIQSALLNTKYEKELSEIQVSEKDKTIRLLHNDENGVWEGECGGVKFPADGKQIQTLIAKLTKVRNMYKISDSQKKWPSLLLTDWSAVTVSYKINDSMSTKLHFGGQNFTKTRRYLRTDSRITSYEIDSDLDMFLTTDESYWFDPYILPRNITAVDSAENIQSVRMNGILYTKKSENFGEKCRKFAELRHGELTAVPQGMKPLYTMQVETGEGLHTEIQVYTAAGGKILAYSFTNTLTGKKYDYNHAVMISGWTFSKIEELFSPVRKQ